MVPSSGPTICMTPFAAHEPLASSPEEDDKQDGPEQYTTGEYHQFEPKTCPLHGNITGWKPPVKQPYAKGRSGDQIDEENCVQHEVLKIGALREFHIPN